MSSDRRHFLAATAGLAGVMGIRSSIADDAVVTPRLIRDSAGSGDMIKLLRETPNEQTIDMMVEQFQKGLSYRHALASLFAATIRQKKPHHVYVLHAIHQLGLDLPAESRLLPVIWAANNFAYWRDRHGIVEDQFTSNAKSAPKPGEAAAVFERAMEDWDHEHAAAALTTLIRSEGAVSAWGGLWPYAGRNNSFIGHYAISLATGVSVLETIGHQHAETFARFVVFEMNDGYANNGEKNTGPQFQANVQRARRSSQQLTPDWARQEYDREVTIQLWNLIREGKTAEACELAHEQLTKHGVPAGPISDAVHLSAADYLVRMNKTEILGRRPVHANTSTNALHLAFLRCPDSESKLLTLLSAVEWCSETIHAWMRGNGVTGDNKDITMRDVKLLELTPAEIPTSDVAAIDEIFATLPSRERKHVASGAVVSDVALKPTREEQDIGSRKLIALLSRNEAPMARFQDNARRYLIHKCSRNIHHFKFLIAAFENVALVNAQWRPHYLAGCLHYLHGPASPDFAVIKEARQRLKLMK